MGLSGTGKSTVAPLLAARLGVGVVDLDRVVEAAAGMTVAELFESSGEPAFREFEAEELARALAGPPAVVATGGGAVLRPGNRELLARRCRVVWLRARPEELTRRLAGTDEARPLLAEDPVVTLRRLAAEREAAYREVADLVVDVDGLGPDGVVDRIARGLPAGDEPDA